jgi:hypothetical protein
MKQTLLLTSYFLATSGSAQSYCNDFDQGCQWAPLPVVIDTAEGTLWQVGDPQKILFQNAYSPVNVIVTDTVNGYPPSNLSRFVVKLPVMDFGWWPEFFLHFQQSFDMDSAHAGGFIEISYDSAQTWMNVFEDWMNPPNIELYEDGVGYIYPDTLSNGQLGFTGTSGDALGGPHWVWSSFCWVQNGIPLPDTLQLRFTFFSDSSAMSRDGWMLDDFQFDVGFIHPVSEFLKADDFLQAVPNPVNDRLFVRFDIDDKEADVNVAFFDASGRLVHTLLDGTRPRGMYNLMCSRSDLGTVEQVLFLRARIGDRTLQQKVLLAEH